MVIENVFAGAVRVPVDTVVLPGELVIPAGATGIVVFAHGSGSSRLSPRNRQVARYLQEKGFGTLLFDLLTPDEDADYFNRFHTALLSERLTGAARWLHRQEAARKLPLGFFGASTGAAAALYASLHCPFVDAIVSRGGRPDMADPVLAQVKAPVLLIVGGEDNEVEALNKKAFDRLESEKKMVVVPGATHLFEEPGKMEEVCRLASGWFENYLH